MADFEPFTMIEEADHASLHSRFEDLLSARTADHDIQYVSHLRKQYPELTVTAVPSANCNLRLFAASGHAVLELENSLEEPLASWRGWVPAIGQGETAGIGQTVFFAKYHYKWSSEDFIVYIIGGIQYILKEPRGSETTLTPSLSLIHI